MTSILAAFVGREPTRARRVVTIGLALLCLLSLVARLAAIFTEAVNWDEFALLARADASLRLGQVVGGGRPGLVSVVLMPFVMDCVDSVRAVVHARVLWQVITLAYLAGTYCLVRRWFIRSGRPDEGRLEGMLAVALLAFLPAFVTWSVQVRTDQAALAAAVWGGVLLLSQGYGRALAAGALFGVSVLCTQKGLYVIALCGVLFLTSSAPAHSMRTANLRSELAEITGRLSLTATGIVLVLAVYLVFVPKAASLASGGALASSLEHMDWYREKLGYRAYTVNASRLLTHWLLFATLIVWTTRSLFRRDRAESALLVTSWVVLLLGGGVAMIHGSSFPYFLMTLGLFPAVALGMSAGRALALAGPRRWAIVAVLIFALVAKSTPETLEMLQGLQQRQRSTMQQINDSGLRNLRGYQVENALFCSGDPDPFPTMFTQQIKRRAAGGSDGFDLFVKEFRTRPIAYIVDSYRLGQFPVEVRQFWQDHYVRHSGALFVAGIRIAAGTAPRLVEAIVPGGYRWIPAQPYSHASLRIGAATVRPGGTVRLEAGWYRLEPDPEVPAGKLVLAALPEPGGDYYDFYDPRQVEQLRGRL